MRENGMVMLRMVIGVEGGDGVGGRGSGIGGRG